jgi:hypothetical protein
MNGNQALHYGLIFYTKNNDDYEYLLQDNLNGTFQDIRIDNIESINSSKIDLAMIIHTIIDYLDLNILYYNIKYYTYNYIKSNQTLIIIAELPSNYYNICQTIIGNYRWIPDKKIKKIIKYHMLKNSLEYDLLNSINHIICRKKYSKKIFI